MTSIQLKPSPPLDVKIYSDNYVNSDGPVSYYSWLTLSFTQFVSSDIPFYEITRTTNHYLTECAKRNVNFIETDALLMKPAITQKYLKFTLH